MTAWDFWRVSKSPAGTPIVVRWERSSLFKRRKLRSLPPEEAERSPNNATGGEICSQVKQDDYRRERLIEMKHTRYWEQSIPNYRSELRMLFDLIDDDWALVDDDDNHDYLLLVNERRDANPIVRPRKDLTEAVVELGLLEFQDGLSQFGGDREYMTGGVEPIPVPHVYFFHVTDEGRAFAEAL